MCKQLVIKALKIFCEGGTTQPEWAPLDVVGVEDELDKATVNIAGVEGEFTVA